MMNRKYTPMIAILGGCIALLVPATAFAASAYYTPEEILYEQEYFFPPRKRDAGERVDEQVQRLLEQVQREQAEAGVKPYSLEYLIPKEEKSVKAIEDPIQSLAEAIQKLIELQDTPEQRRTERLLSRVEEQKAYLRIVGRETNSGAPLAGTGPASALVIMSMIAAAGWTVFKRAQAGTLR